MSKLLDSFMDGTLRDLPASADFDRMFLQLIGRLSAYAPDQARADALEKVQIDYLMNR